VQAPELLGKGGTSGNHRGGDGDHTLPTFWLTGLRSGFGGTSQASSTGSFHSRRSSSSASCNLACHRAASCSWALRTVARYRAASSSCCRCLSSVSSRSGYFLRSPPCSPSRPGRSPRRSPSVAPLVASRCSDVALPTPVDPGGMLSPKGFNAVTPSAQRWDRPARPYWYLRRCGRCSSEFLNIMGLGSLVSIPGGYHWGIR